MPKPQLHVSGLLMLEGCGEQYRRRYIEGERIAPSAAIHIGSAVDAAVNADLQAKIDSGALMPDEQLSEIARDKIVQSWDEQGITLDPSEDETSEAEVKGRSIDAAVALAGLHHAELAPSLQPVAVQRLWTVEVAGLPVDLVGAIDIEEPGRIRDTKTSKKTPKADAAHTSLQLTTYALAKKVIDGAPPDELVLDYLIRTPKRGDTKLVQLPTTRGPEDWDPFLERVDIATRAMVAGIFMPARPDDWRCTAKWCGYFRSCRYAMRPKTVGFAGKENGANAAE